MKISIGITPVRDTYNSYPEEVKFISTEGTIIIEVGDQDLYFDKDEFLKVVKILTMD